MAAHTGTAGIRPAYITAYTALCWLSLVWALWTCASVYLLLGGEKTYRIETAVLILVAVLLPLAIRAAGRTGVYPQLSRREWRGVGFLAVALWLAIYLPLIGFPFLSDDYVFIGLYQGPGDLTKTQQFFRPFYAAVFWLLAEVSSRAPWAFHLLSLALHFASACFVYTLAHRLFSASGPALLCFTVFLLNPLQLEAVLWVSGLQELLWAFFVLAALVTYTRTAVLSVTQLAATMALVALGLLSKETAVCYLLLLPAADWVFFRLKRGPLLLAAYGMFLAELAAYFVVRGRFVSIEASYFAGPSRYFIKQFLTTPYRFFVQPWNVTTADVPLVVLCASAILAIALLHRTIAVRHASRPVWIGVFVIVASTLPVYSYFFVREDLLAARYVYFAAAGWAVILVALIGSLATTTRAYAVCAAALAIGLAVSLQINLRPWRVAGEIADAIRTDVANGLPPDISLTRWTSGTGVKLILRDGVPYEYGGVGVFINGYDQFLAMARGAGRDTQ